MTSIIRIVRHGSESSSAGAEAGDRGALRTVKWGKKVTTAQRALVDRYASKGDELLEGEQLFVCEACGFIFLGRIAADHDGEVRSIAVELLEVTAPRQ